MSSPFVEAYKSKYDTRRLDFLAMFGTAELLVDRKHNITVSTGQATCLLHIDEQSKASNKDLADYFGGVDPMVMRNMIQPLIDSTIVSEENGYFTIEQAS